MSPVSVQTPTRPRPRHSGQSSARRPTYVRRAATAHAASRARLRAETVSRIVDSWSGRVVRDYTRKISAPPLRGEATHCVEVRTALKSSFAHSSALELERNRHRFELCTKVSWGFHRDGLAVS